MFDTFLTQLAMDIDAHGMAAVEHDVTTVVAAARAAGATPVLITVFADRAAPDVARARAFARLARHLSRHRVPGPVTATRPAPGVLDTVGATA